MDRGDLKEMNDNILELRKISKSFSGVEVLHDVSFSLRRGEIHALLGENGAGKSTLVKIITGYHGPDNGECYLEGNPVKFTNTSESSQAGIAAIYQELSLFPDLDVAENIFIGRHPTTKIGSVEWRQLYKEAGKLLDSLGIKLDLRKKARSLSIAQQQIVEIARAFSINARILIMDEPTSSLTLNEVADLFHLVRSLRDRGTSIIFISHRLEELFELVDRVTILRDGYFVDTCSIEDVTRDDLIRMMVGRKISNQFPKLSVQAGDVVLRVEDLSLEGVFKSINFEVRQGEILGLSGLVGARRTDVACAIFGVKPATSGKIFIDGQEVEIKSAEQAMQLGISYVPEDRQKQGLIPDMNLISNVSLPLLDEFSVFWLDKE